MSFIGLDLGSTSIKAALLDPAAGTITHVRSRPFPDPLPGKPALWFEIDPEPVLAHVRELLAELAALSPAPLRGLLCCSQMGGVILVTPDGQQHTTNYLSWRDQRVLEPHPNGRGTYFDEVQRRTTDDDLLAIGRELRPGSTPGLLFWLHENVRLPAGTVAVNLTDYVLSRLCKTPPRQEATLALGTLDLRTRAWKQDWFDRLGLTGIAWPALVPHDRPVGRYEIAGQSIPCYPAIGDQQAALYGAELVEGELSLNISTGSQAAVLASSLTPGDYQTRPYLGGKYLNTITHLPAGRSLNALVGLLGELAAAEGHPLRDPWTKIAEAVARAEPSDLTVNLAFFAGSLGDHGCLDHIRLENLTVGHLFLAAFESMAANYELCAGRLRPSRDWQGIVLSGGLAQRFPRLRELIRQRLAGRIRMVDAAEETLQGLLRLARELPSS